MAKHGEALKTLQANADANAGAAVELVLYHPEQLPDGGIELLERHHKAGHVQVKIPLATLHEASDQLEKAVLLLQESVHSGELNALLNLGVILMRTGRQKEGLNSIKRAAKRGDKKAKRQLRKLESTPFTEN